MNLKKVKVILVACFAATLIAPVAAQNTQKNGTSYAPVDIKESFASIMSRMKSAKPAVMKRQMDLLNERYDLSKKVTTEATMSRGKPLPAGPATRLAQGQTWEKLAEMTPEEIKEKGLFPKGFMPLPHPNHPEGGMIFPKMHDLKVERFYKPQMIYGMLATAQGPIKTFPLRGIKDSPPYLHDGRLLTLEDSVEFFNIVLGLKLTPQEKKDMIAFLRVL